MKNINLKGENKTHKKRGSGKSSIIIGFSLLVLAAIIYGAIFFLKMNEEKKITQTESQVKELKKAYDREDIKKAYDFEEKIHYLENLQNEHKSLIQSEALNVISELTFPETVFTDLKQQTDGQQVSITGKIKVPSFEFLSKQMEKYIASEKLSSVSFGESVFEEGAVYSQIDMTLYESEEKLEETKK